MTYDKIIQIGNLFASSLFTNEQTGRIYSPHGLAPTILCMGGG